MSRLVLGSRGSALALAQVQLVREALARAHPDLEVALKIITTSGDRRQDISAGEGGPAGLKGLFTKEIQEALLEGSIDAAVHSLKDLPGITPPSLILAAVLPRADASDLLISATSPHIGALPRGARIGTGSVRRSHQLRWVRPDLEIADLRGNVPTRLQKLISQNLHAIVLARAGLDRLGYTISENRLACDAGTFHAAPLDILPAIGQGAIGLEIRADDAAAAAILSSIDHPETHLCIRVERELLRLLDGDCRLPVAARATVEEASGIHARAIVFLDGGGAPAEAQATGSTENPEALALSLFHQLKGDK
jgi:hydroxymethylbilane synthase